MFIEEDSLNLDFFTPSSIIFSYRNIGIDGQIHVHMSSYNVIKTVVIISDKNKIKNKASLDYIARIISELDLQLGETFGFLKKGVNQEEFLSIRYNQHVISFPPTLTCDSDPEYRGIRNDIASEVYRNIGKKD